MSSFWFTIYFWSLYRRDLQDLSFWVSDFIQASAELDPSTVPHSRLWLGNTLRERKEDKKTSQTKPRVPVYSVSGDSLAPLSGQHPRKSLSGRWYADQMFWLHYLWAIPHPWPTLLSLKYNNQSILTGNLHMPDTVLSISHIFTHLTLATILGGSRLLSSLFSLCGN